MHVKRVIFIFLGNLVLGSVLILNQFGYLISKRFDISILSPIWEIDFIPLFASIDDVLLLLLFLLALHILVFFRKGGLGKSLFQGLLIGFFLIPAIGLSLMILLFTLWLLMWFIKIIIVILSYIAIPIVWILSHIVAPIISFIMFPFVWFWGNILYPVLEVIAIPFVWVWNQILQPILSFIAIPFVWIINNIITPILHFIIFYIIKPVILFLIVIVAGLVALLPIVAIGSVVSKTIEDTLLSKYDNDGIFSYGIGLGLLLVDTVSTFIIYNLGYSTTTPSLIILLTILLCAIFLIRFVLHERKRTIIECSLGHKCSNYWKTSKLQLAIQICLLPLGAALYILAPKEE